MERDVSRFIHLVIDCHHPALRRFVPDKFWVTAAMAYDGVAVPFGPGPATVVTRGNRFAAACACVRCNQNILVTRLESRRIFAVHYGAARETPIAKPLRV